MKLYISSEESIMAGKGEGEVNIVNCEQPRIGGGRGGNRGGGRGIGGGRERGEGRGRGGGKGDPKPFRFPFLDEDTTTTMKNISPSILPNFHGLRSEDPETFHFEFKVLCKSYDYLLDPQKLKLFPTTLKDATLKCSTLYKNIEINENYILREI